MTCSKNGQYISLVIVMFTTCVLSISQYVSQ